MVSAMLLAVGIHASGNLVVNPSFTGKLEGWNPVWARQEGAAKVAVVDGRSGFAAQIVHIGEGDWALSQSDSVKVSPDDLYELSAWIKTEGGTGGISTVTRTASGETIQWLFGELSPKKPGWQLMRRKIGLPANCNSLQFRITGSGKGTTWVEAPSLVRLGPRVKNSQSVQLSSKYLSFEIRPDGSIRAKTQKGQTWDYRSWEEEFLINSVSKVDPLKATLNVTHLPTNIDLSVSIQLSAVSPEVSYKIQGQGDLDSPIPLPNELVTKSGQWIVLPMNEGIQFPVEDNAINGLQLITYGGHGLCMPWTGVYNPASGAGAMTILETPDDAHVLYHKTNELLTFTPRWEASRGALSYTRKARQVYLDSGGYVAMAKRYRTYAEGTGLVKTLKDKLKTNPNISRLIGAVNVWNWDMNKIELCQEMKKLGFGKVLWSSGGTPDEIHTIAGLGYLPGRYDIYQDVWDPKNSLSWQLTAGWPDDLVLLQSGDWMKGWAHPDKHADGTITWYQGGVICSKPGLERAKQMIPPDIAKEGYLARFIDTTTASPWRECFNPKHPLTRSQDRAYKMSLLDFCSKEMKQVVGTETGIDPSVPYVDYYEGMMSLGPYRLPDSGTFMMEYRKPTPDFLKYQVGSYYRIPLWELVYHDCTVAQWYWGDASNKAPEVWTQRDLLNILYGTPPLLMFDQARWNKDKMRMLQTYRNVCEWVDKIGYDQMLSHQYLTDDHTVQQTKWSSGRSVIVNFGVSPYNGIAPSNFKIADKTVR